MPPTPDHKIFMWTANKTVTTSFISITHPLTISFTPSSALPRSSTSTLMDYSSEESHPTQPRHQHEHKHKASSTELLANAQLLAGAAFNRKGADKAKLSEAAEEMLAAAEDYGKFGEGSYGAYFEKAEGFLHKYHASESDHGTGDSTAGKTQHALKKPVRKEDDDDEYESGGYAPKKPVRKDDGDEYESGGYAPKKPVRKDDDEEYESGGYAPKKPARREDDDDDEYESGGYAPKKPVRKDDDEEESESGGGFGDYLKMAQGFLKK